MNTHNIELPPMPEARIVSYQTDSTMRRMELRTYSDKDMKAYARAAIEADRQLRGEPVACFKCGHAKHGGECVNVAPQSAEPDYKQLFEQMCERCDALDAKLAEYSEREPVAYMFADEWGRTKIVLGKETAEHWCPPDENITPLSTNPQPAEPDDPNTSPRSGKGPFESASDLINSINEPVKAPGDGVRCNWCGWRGIEDDLVIEIAADEPEEGPANVCPTCKRIGCLMDLGCDERAAQGLPPYKPSHPTEEEWNRLTENGRRAWGKKPSEPVKMTSSFPTGTEYSVEPHGKGYAIYQGRDQFHHGLNLAHLTECTPEFSKRIESALNAIHEPEGWQLVPKELMRLMPEVLASLKGSGVDVSLAADVERALAADPKFGEKKND